MSITICTHTFNQILTPNPIFSKQYARGLGLITELVCICATDALTLEDCLRYRLPQRRPLLQPVCFATDIGRASALNVKNVRIK